MPPFMLLKKLLECKQRARAMYARQKAERARSGPSAQAVTSKGQSIKLENMENMCRLCLKEGFKPIFDEGGNEKLADKIRDHASIELTESDSFPKFICEACLALLRAAVQLRATAQESDQRLREFRISSENKTHLETDSIKYSHEQDDDRTSSSAEDVAETNHKADEINYFLFCKKCNMTFKNNAEMVAHHRSLEHQKDRVPCPQCGVTVNNHYLSTHVLRRHSLERPYVCEVCGRAFAVQGAFKRHAAVHTTVLRFACPDCPYRGRFSESLRAHRQQHGGEKRYACHQCPARFHNKSNLNKHARSHSTERTFKCGECNKGFHTSRELTEHHNVQHSGARDHVCDICGKDFGYRKAMVKHQRKVHHVSKGFRGRMPLYLQLQREQGASRPQQ